MNNAFNLNNHGTHPCMRVRCLFTYINLCLSNLKADGVLFLVNTTKSERFRRNGNYMSYIDAKFNPDCVKWAKLTVNTSTKGKCCNKSSQRCPCCPRDRWIRTSHTHKWYIICRPGLNIVAVSVYKPFCFINIAIYGVKVGVWESLSDIPVSIEHNFAKYGITSFYHLIFQYSLMIKHGDM